MAQYVGNRGAPYSSPWPWLTEYPITQVFGQNGETGIDLGTPYGTPITSLTAGQVLGTGYYNGGGVVSVACVLNGQPASVYYQHLDLIATGIYPGVAVRAGQQLGISGGQLSGGHHPSSPQYSTGPHTEVGFNAPYGSFWNPQRYTPNVNPLPYLASILNGATLNGTLSGNSVLTLAATTLVGGGNGGAAMVQASTAAGFMPLAQILHDAETIRPLDPNNLFGSVVHDVGAGSVRAIYAALALILIIAVIWRELKTEVAQVAQLGNTAASTAGGAASLISALQ